MKKGWILSGLLYIIFLGGMISLGNWYADYTINDMDEFSFCLDVVYNNITDDSKVVNYCQKKMDDLRTERELKEKERNEKFLKKLQN